MVAKLPFYQGEKMIEKFFEIQKKGSTIKTEIISGITIFAAMSYILAVNPSILSSTGMDAGAIFTATALVSAITSILMGLIANYPIALAPGMGINAFFAFTVVAGMGLSWQTALGAVIVSGILFTIISVTGLRVKIINAIPKDLKKAVSVALGMFIAFIGLKNAGLIISNPDTLVSIGNMSDPQVLLALFGLAITFILVVRKSNLAVFLGMLTTLVVGVLFGLVSIPDSIIQEVPSIAPTFAQGIKAIPEILVSPELWVVVITFLFMDFFDTSATLLAVADKIGKVNHNGEVENAGKVMFVDSIGTFLSGIFGTSSTTSYAESIAGTAIGGKTGLSAITVGILFLASMFFFPLTTMFTNAVTAPALIVVGALMMTSISDIDFKNEAIMVSSFMIIMMTIGTQNLSEGMAFGFIIYPIVKVLSGEIKDIHPMMWLIFSIFAGYFIFL